MPCGTGRYGVLVGISPRYPPVAGRLHTRYAPVRRSSAEYCYSLLPLDLHVLSLPLAFILSQDQTLHCKNCFSLPLTRLVSRPAASPRNSGHTLSHLHISFKVLSPPIPESPVRGPPVRRKRVQRYNLFPFHQKKISLFSGQNLKHTAKQTAARKYFFQKTKKTPQYDPQITQKTPLFPQKSPTL